MAILSPSARPSAHVVCTRSIDAPELDRTAQVRWPMDDEFDFRIVGNVREIERPIRERAGMGRPPDSSPDSAGPGPTPTTPATSSPT